MFSAGIRRPPGGPPAVLLPAPGVSFRALRCGRRGGAATAARRCSKAQKSLWWTLMKPRRSLGLAKAWTHENRDRLACPLNSPQAAQKRTFRDVAEVPISDICNAANGE